MEGELTRFGEVLRDRYRLERELGRGGMATVFLAEDLRHHRFVALKVLHRDVAVSLGAGRFLREIEIAGRLVHPHILSLLDSGEADGLLYYVMPYVPGDSLRARLRREGELPVDVAVHILREVLDALAHAHAQGIVHRDIKPENVLFLGPHVQLADFGIAKAIDAAAPALALTQAGMVVGTPVYMAPEQAAGDPQLDHRADLYATGVLAYEMLAGRPPFSGSDAGEIVRAQISRAAEPIERVRPAVAPALAGVIIRALEKRPADRWQSAEEMRRQIDLVLATFAETRPSLPAGGEPEIASYRLTETLCRRLERTSFDPRLIGDAIQYLDNLVASDVLVACVPACGLGADEFAPFLRATRYRAIAVTLLGWEKNRRWRPRLSFQDHLVLVRDWLRAMAARTGPRLVVLVGFSSGGDFVLRLGAAPVSDPPMPLDACVPLGANLALETCFVTRFLATLDTSSDTELVAALGEIGRSAETLDEWTDLYEYILQMVRKFRGDFEPLRVFARDVVRPFETSPLEPFAEWYREATRQGRHLRCVFEDTPSYHRLVRDLQLRNLDEGILGDHYQEDSIVFESDAGHFDLLDPARIEHHVDALVERLRGAPQPET